MELVLEVEDLTKDYGGFRAVDNISFKVKRGQVLGLLGPNGAGKSTTIQMLMGITLETSGQVKYFGHNFKTNRQKCLQRINFASAYNTLQGRMTAAENLKVFAGLYRVKNPESKIAELLEFFEIGRLAKNRYWDLSAGERTRVNLAKALLNDPELILMDEPTSSLDPDIADKTLSLIEDLRAKRNLSILFTSHNMQEVTRVCDEVIFLDRGKIVSQDTPANHIKKLKGTELVITYKGKQENLEKLLKNKKLKFSFLSDDAVKIQTSGGHVGQLISLIEQNKFQILDTIINRPTLEDVFLQIAREGKGDKG